MEVLKTESLKKYYNQSKVVVKAIDAVSYTHLLDDRALYDAALSSV